MVTAGQSPLTLSFVAPRDRKIGQVPDNQAHRDRSVISKHPSD
jgi:hypothetical protein